VSKYLAGLTPVVGLAVIATGCGGGRSSDSSSEWPASDAANAVK
jgi:hypothetical protein